MLRLGAIQLGFMLALVFLIGRAAQIQLVEGANHEANAIANRTRRVERPAERGRIYDRNGVLLASGQQVFTLSITPRELTDRQDILRRVVEDLGVSRTSVDRQMRRQYGYLAGPFDDAQIQSLRHLPGLYFEPYDRRFHPRSSLASALLGQPGEPGRPASGIERQFDSLLTGVPGSTVVLQDQFQNPYESPSRADAFPVPGADVFLTIDASYQELVERELLGAIERYDALGGDVVVLHPQTGEILAAASFDGRRRDTPAVFAASFEPGSTAKLFAAAALLSHDLVGQNDSVWGEGGSFPLGSRVITDTHPEGWMRLRDVIRRSSNIGIVKFAERLSPDQQYLMLRAFGVGTPTGVEFPSEARGSLPHPDRWSSTTAASLTFGYEIAMTMVQIAQAYGAIANDGVMTQPTLVHRIRDASGRDLYRHEPVTVRRVIPADVAAELRSMLRAVVYEGGTGETAALFNYEVGGKTGTARRFVDGQYVVGSNTTTFASLFPADTPQLVMVVKLDDPTGAYARLTAAPTTRSMLEQMIAAPTSSLELRRMLSTPVAESHPDPELGYAPFVAQWPLDAVPIDSTERVVPDVVGRGLREAVRMIHQTGLRVSVEAVGMVQRVDPPAGERVPLGTVVRVFGGTDSSTP